MTALKGGRAKRKVSLALGGWNDSKGDKYSRLVNDPKARRYVPRIYLLKTVTFIAGKKNPAIQFFLFLFPLKISFKTSVCMH